MSTTTSHSSLRWSDLSHPIVVSLLSVIVNYGGTFVLVFQAAKVVGLSPELTVSWGWSISIGIGLTGLLLSWMAYQVTSRSPLRMGATVVRFGQTICRARAKHNSYYRPTTSDSEKTT